MVTGGVGGFFAGLTGVGGGAILVPLFTTLLRMPQHRAHGTSLAVVVFAAIAGGSRYIWQDAIDWALAGALLSGSLLGAYLGARWVMRIPERELRLLFSLFLVAVGARMLVA